MPTQKPRFSIAMDEDLLSQVDDYKFGHRVKSQNQAINDLIRAGLTKALRTLEQEEKENPPASPEGEDREITVEQLERMLVELGYIKPGEDLSDVDLRFLLAVGQALRAWFADR